MPQDLGIVGPASEQRRWKWPFSEMQIGDWFMVHESDRSPGAVRNFVYVSGHRLGMAFSVEAPNEYHPGYTRVTRVDPARKRAEDLPFVEWGTASAMVKEAYGVDLCGFGVPWGSFWVGATYREDRKRIAEPYRQDLILWITEAQYVDPKVKLTLQEVRELPIVSKSFHLQLNKDHLFVERYEDSFTYPELMEKLHGQEIDKLMG